jgi:hypothetical protein
MLCHHLTPTPLYLQKLRHGFFINLLNAILIQYLLPTTAASGLNSNDDDGIAYLSTSPSPAGLLGKTSQPVWAINVDYENNILNIDARSQRTGCYNLTLIPHLFLQ